MKIALIVALTALLLFVTTRLVHIENQRYALILGMCRNNILSPELPNLRCLETVETRTSWAWHVYYALMN